MSRKGIHMANDLPALKPEFSSLVSISIKSTTLSDLLVIVRVSAPNVGKELREAPSVEICVKKSQIHGSEEPLEATAINRFPDFLT